MSKKMNSTGVPCARRLYSAFSFDTKLPRAIFVGQRGTCSAWTFGDSRERVMAKAAQF